MLNESKSLELIKRQRETGLTVTDFCSNEGLAPSTFYYWRKKLGKEPGNGFIPLLVKSAPSSFEGRRKSSLQDENGHQQPKDDFLMELVYPNGTKLRIKNDLDLSHLRALVNLLD
jgi:transposase-like protein